LTEGGAVCDGPRGVITGRTALLAIVADPVAQARAPFLVNRALAERGADAVLVPLHVGSDGLASVVSALRSVRNFAGALFSMPHKAAIVPLLDDVTPEGRKVGACNAVRREPDGRLVGTMYDGEGFVAGLRGAGHDVRGRRVFLAGAGGAASAIAFALGKHGAAALMISNARRRRPRRSRPGCEGRGRLSASRPAGPIRADTTSSSTRRRSACGRATRCRSTSRTWSRVRSRRRS
jgi:shikimate 5-dehydrogenase